MYLDHNATSPMSPRVQEAMSEAMRHAWANPSSPHVLGQAACAQVEHSRRIIGDQLGVPAKWVYFTSGATEGNAWVLSGSAHPVVASAVEHPSVLAWSDEHIAVNEGGVVDLADLETRLEAGPALVSVMAANNETGILQPIEEVAEICAKHGALFHCDATQAFGRYPAPIKADFITVSAHKFGGPRGVGAMIAKTPPRALLQGGKQERGARAGTLNAPAIIGFAEAIQEHRCWTSGERDKLEAFCVKRGGRIIGKDHDRLPNTFAVLFDIPGDLLVTALDLNGIQASTGSACASGSTATSHVLEACGITGIPVRFSFGPESLAGPAIDALGQALDNMVETCV